MLKSLLVLILQCTYAFASVPEDTKQQKRGILGNDGWIGLPNPYGHGHPWTADHTALRALKLSEVNLHAGLHLADAIPYGRGGIALTPGILKTFPVYVTKHVILEKPVPVPEPVIIEKPYHVPIPIEKIIHKPVPIPIPVPQAVPIPVEHPVPIPVKHPIAVPVQQPYPVPVRQPVPVAVPVPVPVPVIANGVAGALYPRDYAAGHHLLVPPPIHLGHLGHLGSLEHGLGHGLAALPHDYGYVHNAVHAGHIHDVHHAHEHDHKKRKTEEDKNN